MSGTIIHPAKVTTYQNLLPPMALSAPRAPPRGFCWLLRNVSVRRSSFVSNVDTLLSRSGEVPEAVAAPVDEGASNLSDDLYMSQTD